MNWLKRLRIYVRDQADKVSKRHKKEGFWKTVVRGGAGFISETLSALLAALVVAVLTTSPPGDHGLTGSFATKQGEYRCEQLPEGSEVCLNTASVVRYTYSRNVRHVELVCGEASFLVRNERRPFDVVSGGLIVRDLSTSFDVYRKRKSTQVTVLDGRIKIIAPISNEARLPFDQLETEAAWKTAPEFHRRQQIELEEATGTLQVRPELSEERLSQLVAWKHGYIDLSQRTLGEALDEFSRYQPVAHFKYSDKSIGQIVVTGNMEFGDLDGFLAALQHEFQIDHAKEGTGTDTVVTLSRHPISTRRIRPNR